MVKASKALLHDPGLVYDALTTQQHAFGLFEFMAKTALIFLSTTKLNAKLFTKKNNTSIDF